MNRQKGRELTVFNVIGRLKTSIFQVKKLLYEKGNQIIITFCL